MRRVSFIARADARCADARARSVLQRVRAARPPNDPRLERFLDESARVGDALKQYSTFTGRPA